MSEAEERAANARKDVEEARQALDATKWWQPSKRARASEEFKIRLVIAGTAEALARRAAVRDDAEREMLKWVDRLLKHNSDPESPDYDRELSKMGAEEVILHLLAIGRRGN